MRLHVGLSLVGSCGSSGPSVLSTRQRSSELDPAEYGICTHEESGNFWFFHDKQRTDQADACPIDTRSETPDMCLVMYTEDPQEVKKAGAIKKLLA